MLISQKPFQRLNKDLISQIKFISPNLDEVLAIARVLCPRTESHLAGVTGKSTTVEILQAMQEIGPELLESVDNVLVTLGERGVILLTKHDPNDCYYKPSGSGGSLAYAVGGNHPQGLFYSMEDNGGQLCPEDIVNVSGAGDSFSSGFITGMLQGFTANQAVWKGMAAARCALQSHSAVPMSYEMHEVPSNGATGQVLF